MEAGKQHWDTLMIDDITDGTKWAIEQSMADPKRVCIYGASYGGYAALMSAVREPDLYRCAIGYAGVYDLKSWKKYTDVSRTKTGKTFIDDFIGASDEQLAKASPLTYIDRLKANVMIVHGEQDFRVPLGQAEELRKALDARHLHYEWLVKPNEGHGFYQSKNREELYTRMLAFLDQNIGPSASLPPSTATDTAASTPASAAKPEPAH
jgi:dipeptidyl aminopeptidase/acylaminoacyl peptidase